MVKLLIQSTEFKELLLLTVMVSIENVLNKGLILAARVRDRFLGLLIYGRHTKYYPF